MRQSRHRRRNIFRLDISDGVKRDYNIVRGAHCHWRRFIPNFLQDVAQRKGSNI